MNWLVEYNKAIEIIENNLEKSGDVVEKLVSNELGITQREVQSIIKFFIKTTTAKYIIRRRLIRVMDDFMVRKGSLEELACEYGFADYSGFFKAFKRVYGQSPEKILKAGWKSSEPKFIDESIMNINCEAEFAKYHNQGNKQAVSPDIIAKEAPTVSNNEIIVDFNTGKTEPFNEDMFKIYEEISSVMGAYELSLEEAIEMYNSCKGDLLLIDTMCMNELLEEIGPEEPIIPGISNADLYKLIIEFENEEYTSTPTIKYENVNEIKALLSQIMPDQDASLDVRVGREDVIISLTVRIIWIVPHKRNAMNIFKRAIDLADGFKIMLGEDLDGETIMLELTVRDAFEVEYLNKFNQ